MMKPFITKKACLKCHGHQGYAVGNVRGGVSLSVPMLQYREHEYKAIRNIIISFTALWGIGLFFILIFINKLQTIIKQRIELQQVSGKHELLAKHHEELREAHGKIEAQNKLLEEFSNTDALTSIANRRYFDLILKRECGGLSRAKSSLSLSLIMCDIDYFKQYNDTYGHKKGDECLQRIAGAIRSVVRRAIDCIARYGGEEFAIILPGTESDDAEQLAEEVRKAVENLRIPHDNSEVDTIVTMSFGVASITNQDKESDFISILVSKADKALYMAKTSGRNKVVQSKIT
ncbi:MAG: diguanylate cyclase [Deltaproteobacteria bacterium]|nr:diguanylate cyclase [Deltaproteobacteria bacterium]